MNRACVVLLVFGACGGHAPSVRGDAPTDDIPLGVGTRWIYAGTQETPGHSEPVRVTAEVTAAVHRGEVTLARIARLPGFADDSLIVRRGRRYWIVDAKPAATQRLADPGDSLEDLVPATPPTFAFPVVEGKVACDEGGDPDESTMYCTNIEPAGEAGGSSIVKATQYMRIYRTHPDDTEIFFAEGVGVTGYGAHHHGTTDSLDLSLVEFRPAR